MTTAYTSDPTFNVLTSVTDPLSHTTSFAYDSRGRIQSSTNALSHQTAFSTNTAGQVVSVTDPLSKVTQFTYSAGDLVSVETPLGHTTARLADAAGRLVGVTNASGARAQFEYNAHDLITKMTDPQGGETTFTYDGNGNLLTLTDARNKTTTWTYDDMDRVVTRTDPLTRAESFVYDLMGNLISWTDRKTQVTTYQYDALERQTFVGFGTVAGPTYASTIATTYDAGDRATDIVDSGAGTIERNFDVLDRLTEEITPEGTISYTYDAAGRRASMTVAGQTAVSYSYDNADRLTSVTRGTPTVSIAYDNADKRSSLTLPNGIIVAYSYDDDSRLAGLTYSLGMSTLGTLTYGYDVNGQRMTVGGTYARTSLPAVLASASYDDANQIATFGGTSFTYDANGNLASDGVRSYSWNARNELASLSGPVSGSFAYDGVGRRWSKSIGGTTWQFLYDGLNPVQELSNGTPTANLLAGLGIDEFFTRTDSIGVCNYLTDALGSSVALTDASGTIQTEYTYDPFGSTATSGASSGSGFGFTGRESDATGLYYYRARYYDPALTRFVSEDPLDFAAGDVNLHGYVSNSPTRWTDPTGMAQMLAPPGCRSHSGKSPPAWINLLCGQIPYFGGGFGPGVGAAAAAAAASGAGAGAGAGASAAGQGITVSAEAMAHVAARHLIPGTAASYFYENVNISQLLSEAAGVLPKAQSYGPNMQRVVDAGRVIGYDVVTRAPVSVYTVITNVNNGLVTMFPGLPRR